MTRKSEEKRNPFVKGSLYRVRSLGTQEAPTESTGLFLGFTQVGMAGEGLMIELGKDHGDLAGKIRVVPLHMLMSVDILEQKEEEKVEEEEGHPVSYS